MAKTINNPLFFISALGACFAAFFSSIIQAQFSLNFTPSSGSMSTNIEQGVIDGVIGENVTVGNQTAFLFEGQSLAIVTDPATGKNYYHMITGNPLEGFAQEVYIETNSVPGTFSLSSTYLGDNAHDPLGQYLDHIGTGNGQANPRKVIMRQVINDGEMMMEFKKDHFLKKPVITQLQSSADFNAIFRIDMRNSTYDDMTTAGNVINIQDFTDPWLSGIARFDVATDGQKVHVNGGRYKHIEGSGNGGTDGSYEYIDGQFNVNEMRWEDFFDHTADNPWSYDTLRPQL